MLTIKGEKQEEKEEKTKDRYVSERRYGSFLRSLQVPGSVDANKIEASFKNGVLTVTDAEISGSAEEGKTISRDREVSMPVPSPHHAWPVGLRGKCTLLSV